MNRITIEPIQGHPVFDEQGQPLTNKRSVHLTEFWARRIRNGDVHIIESENKETTDMKKGKSK